MNFEPQKFFIGLMDFFAILLPGALLTYLFMDDVGPAALGERYHKLISAESCTEAWAAFLFASYLSGHLIFLLGSWLDVIYDWRRDRPLKWQVRRLARGGRLLPWFARALVFKHERNLAQDLVEKIKDRTLGPLQAKNAINAFQWSKALLTLENPQSLAVVQRFEADSKFFRSFIIVLLVLLVVWPFPYQRWPAGSLLGLFLLMLALWRYREQRHKSTNQAYWSVITLTANKGKLVLEKPAPAPGTRTHAGGVVFRMRGGKAQYLLVEATNDPDQWVLPKGHVEEGERHRETAVREVHEETGVWARIEGDLGDMSYTVNGQSITVRCYLMKAAGRGLRKDKNRQHVWLSLPEAITQASHLETRDRLQAAEQRRVRSTS